MKGIFTISIDEDLIARIKLAARSGPYRNQSHLVEDAIKRLLEGAK